MDDFMDAKLLLNETGGGIEVADESDLGDKALYFLGHPDEAQRIGLSARQAVEFHQGAAQKHAEVIKRVLDT
jgi:hypothetical protein